MQLHGGKVLVVDDSAASRNALKEILAADGFAVVGEAADGLEACRLLEAEKPDVMILDLVLPELPGMDVLAKAQSLSPGTKVLVLTALDTDRYAAQCLEAGASDFMGKPFDPKDLLSTIKKILAAG